MTGSLDSFLVRPPSILACGASSSITLIQHSLPSATQCHLWAPFCSPLTVFWCSWVHFGSIFHQKCVLKPMQNSMSKKYGHLKENAPKMVPKQGPESMTNLWNFGTCDFLFFVKGITLKSFFHMIMGTWNLLSINKKSMRIRCSKKRCTNQKTCSKREPEWEPKSRNYR